MPCRRRCNAAYAAAVIALAGIGSASAGQFEFSSPAVAGAPGLQTAPLLDLTFRGDGETTDAQIDLVFDPARFTPVLTPRNGALCQVFGDRVRVVSPSSAAPLTAAQVRYCSLRFSVAVGTPTGSYNFAPDLKATECSGVNGAVSPCTAPSGIGVIRVGLLTPAPVLNYVPATSDTVLLVNGNAEISADFVPGGFGAAIEVHDCLITAGPGAVFASPMLAPQPFAFVSTLPGTGLIGLSCTRQVQQTTAALDCVQTRNGVSDQSLHWNLVCPALPAILIHADGFESPG